MYDKNALYKTKMPCIEQEKTVQMLKQAHVAITVSLTLTELTRFLLLTYHILGPWQSLELCQPEVDQQVQTVPMMVAAGHASKTHFNARAATCKGACLSCCLPFSVALRYCCQVCSRPFCVRTTLQNNQSSADNSLCLEIVHMQAVFVSECCLARLHGTGDSNGS